VTFATDYNYFIRFEILNNSSTIRFNSIRNEKTLFAQHYLFVWHHHVISAINVTTLSFECRKCRHSVTVQTACWPLSSRVTPVVPVFLWWQAEPCRSVEQAFRRCPNGMFAEIKYDGERVQLHKKGTSFKYFSRSLKPVQQHKVLGFFTLLNSTRQYRVPTFWKIGEFCLTGTVREFCWEFCCFRELFMVECCLHL